MEREMLLKIINEEIVTVIEAAELMEVSVQRIYQFVKEKKLCPVKKNSKIFLRRDVLKLREDQEKKHVRYGKGKKRKGV